MLPGDKHLWNHLQWFRKNCSVCLFAYCMPLICASTKFCKMERKEFHREPNSLIWGGFCTTSSSGPMFRGLSAILLVTQTDFGDSVKSIIDHHVDERQYSCELHANCGPFPEFFFAYFVTWSRHTVTCCLRIIRPVGSCATLVAELLLQSSFPSSLLPWLLFEGCACVCAWRSFIFFLKLESTSPEL